MLSRSGLYALQATLHLARNGGDGPVSAARVAEDLELPPEYLAKVLRHLSKEGLLSSTRGVRGGYTLTTPPDALTVHQVVEPFEELTPLKKCLLGGTCHSDRPCPAHIRRVEWNEARQKILAATLLTDLLPSGTADGDGVAALLSGDPDHTNEDQRQ